MSWLWKCICGLSSLKSDLEVNLEYQPELEEPEQDDIAEDREFVTYSTSTDQPLRSVPVQEGEVWFLSDQATCHATTLSLYINGMSLLHEGHEVSIAFSPFTLVRNCKFPTNDKFISELKLFKVGLMSQRYTYFFGVESEEQRSQWVINLSHAIRTVTHSLFPPYNVSCRPKRGKKWTESRLVAGYLLVEDSDSTASLVFAELHPHGHKPLDLEADGELHEVEGRPSVVDQNTDATACIRLYETSSCRRPLLDIPVAEADKCSEMPGINCSCFSVGRFGFTSRTMAERKLWLRAISNLKVKIMNKAPPPDAAMLEDYRIAIEEHLECVRPSFEAHGNIDALLARARRSGLHFRGPMVLQARLLGDMGGHRGGAVIAGGGHRGATGRGGGGAGVSPTQEGGEALSPGPVRSRGEGGGRGRTDEPSRSRSPMQPQAAAPVGGGTSTRDPPSSPLSPSRGGPPHPAPFRAPQPGRDATETPRGEPPSIPGRSHGRPGNGSGDIRVTNTRNPQSGGTAVKEKSRGAQGTIRKTDAH
uniref:PH domain-containing protein n=1 Tax=Chromera velia CCMP2878 TaxID=1169474 RepID=A0A0G4HMT4_9ALVE|eukprot:Cvel_29409.t1-p1 / transcript=Cvel_29409.t1 / gene=Cvel_29409 / organism=Chromera_velia_CCMP2878 / gene_product=hypothetical protein / transcript_product=hypothetical protein / location=Cvel_scaffold4012:4169-9071(-) / protein_length=531 / sequence_SO=supercontig / SO=protein_coding / is_pseudo=false